METIPKQNVQNIQVEQKQPKARRQPKPKDPERERKLQDKAKEIFLGLRKLSGTDLLEIGDQQINFSALRQRNLIDSTIRKWVTKKIKEVLGVEEQATINLVVMFLKNGLKVTSESVLDQVGSILEEDAQDFVQKLWQVLLFEHKKVQAGLYDDESSEYSESEQEQDNVHDNGQLNAEPMITR